MRVARWIAALAFAGAAALMQAQTQAQVLDDNVTPEFRAWLVENPWFGADRERTEFAKNYARQLLKERPELTGRALLDAISAKVERTFGAAAKPQKR